MDIASHVYVGGFVNYRYVSVELKDGSRKQVVRQIAVHLHATHRRSMDMSEVVIDGLSCRHQSRLVAEQKIPRYVRRSL